MHQAAIPDTFARAIDVRPRTLSADDRLNATSGAARLFKVVAPRQFSGRPSHLGTPSAAGAQNDLCYARFPGRRGWRI